MNKPTTHDQREFIDNKVKEGWTSKLIAKTLGISKKTVDKWRQRLKKNGQLVSKMGRPTQGTLSTYSKVLRKRIKRIRKANEGWGPISILMELEEVFNYKATSLPSASSVYLYLKQEGFIKEKEPCHPLPNKQIRKAKYAHHKWEMDAKGAQIVIHSPLLFIINGHYV